jgi:hypothetical protein
VGSPLEQTGLSECMSFMCTYHQQQRDGETDENHVLAPGANKTRRIEAKVGLSPGLDGGEGSCSTQAKPLSIHRRTEKSL